MLLARKDNFWCIALRARPESRGCALRVGLHMPHEEGFKPLPPAGVLLSKQYESTLGIRFYPEIYHQGCCVAPRSWHFTSSEPLLRCVAAPSNLSELDSKYHHDIAQRVRAKYPEDVLRADGWNQVERGVFEKFIHVDDLEKIEGPPPEGAF